jgi:hypothetical protein
LAVFALAGLLTFGCTPWVEVDAPDIEVTQPKLFFLGVPAGTPSVTTAQGSFILRSSRLGAAGSPDAGAFKRIQRLDLIRLAFKASTGIADFSFLTHLSVEATNPTYDSTPPACRDRPVVQILNYDVPPDPGAVLQIPMVNPVDLLPLWGCPSLYVTVEASGQPPVVDWTMDVVFSLSLKISQ